jgi:trk system potassium uptake protein TrkH
VVFLSIRSFLSNRNGVEVYRRTLPSSVSVISLTLLLVYTSLVIFFSTLLLVTQDNMNFRNAIFEIMSVMSSVGYSSGAVGTLDDIGRVIFCVAALVGRLGPLTLLLVLMARYEPRQYQFPEENILLS